MRGDAPITWLMFFTLAAGIVVAAGLFIAFLRSKHNREIAACALEGDARGSGPAPSGAGAELGGILVVALVAMSLLTFGYRGHTGTTVTTGSNPNAIAAHNDPNTPKPYQPQNPAPDTRSAPTSSPSGTGPESGGHPEANPER